jgi:hypothetical protein
MSKSFEEIFVATLLGRLNERADEEASIKVEINDLTSDVYHKGIDAGIQMERERIINLLIELDAIRRDAMGHLVAFNTHGTEVIYLTGLEKE